MAKSLYLITALSRELDVKVVTPAYPHDIVTKAKVEMNWHDGQIGAMPVFSNKRKAERFAKKHGYEVIPLETRPR
jgi:hypothetical protein